jgi:hypothetical protein
MSSRTVSPYSNVPMSAEVRKRYPKDYFKKKKSLRGQGLKKLQREGVVGPRGGVRYQRKLKPYRVDKRIPRGTTITVDNDFGRDHEITTLKSHDFDEETRNIPKKKGEDFVVVWQYDSLKIKRCISTGKYYVYVGFYPRDRYLCEIHLGAMYDMADLIFHDIGAITRTINRAGDGHRYARISVKSKSYWKAAMKREGRL